MVYAVSESRGTLSTVKWTRRIRVCLGYAPRPPAGGILQPAITKMAILVDLKRRLNQRITDNPGLLIGAVVGVAVINRLARRYAEEHDKNDDATEGKVTTARKLFFALHLFGLTTNIKAFELELDDLYRDR